LGEERWQTYPLVSGAKNNRINLQAQPMLLLSKRRALKVLAS